MSEKLSERQVVPLTSEELEELREAAKVAEITPGLYSRVLVTYALGHREDPHLRLLVLGEQLAAADRTAAGARKAAEARWGTQG
ncbi:hypothetical protein [Gordonia sihwensis]|uniref:hypothetical protein n=1 Tax=Gordonia sihwensis TaxID=173559 RepID=UPI003D9592A0